MAAGHRVVMHVHDEILENAPLAEVERIVSTGPWWSEGLPIGLRVHGEGIGNEEHQLQSCSR